jgi:hypothetical protein
LVFPVNAELDRKNYIVRDFVEYYQSVDGVFFPIKITSSLASDPAKTQNLKPSGKVAALSIKLNQPLEIPEIKFPSGTIVFVDNDTDSDSETNGYIWGDDNKPLKKLTDKDYESALQNYKAEKEKNVTYIKITTFPNAFCFLIAIGVGIVIVIVIFLVVIFSKNKKDKKA